MIVKKTQDVPLVPVEMEGAKDVSVRVLFGPGDNAPTFAMRLFELDNSGHTPWHSHPFEHQIIIMEGHIALVTAQREYTLNVGSVALVPPDQMHQFKNLSDTASAKMICLVPVEYQK